MTKVPEVKVVNYKTARQKIVNVPFCKSEKYKEQQRRARWLDLSTVEARKYYDALYDVREFNRAFVAKCKKMGIPMFTHCCLRDAATQTQLHIMGRSNAKAGQSAHNYALAVDVIHGTMAWNIPRLSWDILGHVGHEVAHQKGIDMRWGGDWDSDGIPVHSDEDENLWDPALGS
jgi:hypothetical protein